MRLDGFAGRAPFTPFRGFHPLTEDTPIALSPFAVALGATPPIARLAVETTAVRVALVPTEIFERLNLTAVRTALVPIGQFLTQRNFLSHSTPLFLCPFSIVGSSSIACALPATTAEAIGLDQVDAECLDGLEFATIGALLDA
jgi:hypothetical protein